MQYASNLIYLRLTMPKMNNIMSIIKYLGVEGEKCFNFVPERAALC